MRFSFLFFLVSFSNSVHAQECVFSEALTAHLSAMEGFFSEARIIPESQNEEFTQDFGFANMLPLWALESGHSRSIPFVATNFVGQSGPSQGESFEKEANDLISGAYNCYYFLQNQYDVGFFERSKNSPANCAVGDYFSFEIKPLECYQNESIFIEFNVCTSEQWITARMLSPTYGVRNVILDVNAEILYEGASNVARLSSLERCTEDHDHLPIIEGLGLRIRENLFQRN